MSAPLTRAERSPRWPVAATLGLGLLLAARLGPDALARGGLAPLAVGAVLAGFVGVPLARAEWATAPETNAERVEPGAWERASFAVAELWVLLAVGAVAAPLVTAHGPRALAAVAAGWAVCALVGRGRGLVVGLVGALAFAALLAVGVDAARRGVPWSLLAPRWEAWREWLPLAVAAGLLLPAAGLGQWSALPAAVPGLRRLPWAVAGLGLLAALAAAVAHGVAFELAPGEEVLAGPALVPIAALAGAMTASACRRGRRSAALQALGGTLAAAWFAGPAAGALPQWWAAVFPLGPAFVALALAARARGPARWAPATLAAALVAGVAAAWPGLPAPGAAAALAFVPVVAVWWAGTRALTWRAA